MLSCSRCLSAILLVALSCARASAQTSVTAEPLHADSILVLKSQHQMQLLARGQVIRTYRVALGPGKGPKEHEGDHRTPEGKYTIDSRNEHSHYHLALHVSYPNAHDLARARAEGHPPGGLIMIHGLPDAFALIGKAQANFDWTNGCIALSNAEIEEVWNLVPVGTPIEIRP